MRPPSAAAGGRHRPHFFKVFIPALSAHRLAIPRAFLKHLAAGTPPPPSPPRDVELAGPSGRAWRVRLAAEGGEAAFERGWAEFVADHSLQHGDFLVFRYDGGSRFSVLVFDRTACEKAAAFSVVPKDRGGAVDGDGEEGGRSSVKRKRTKRIFTHLKKSKTKPIGQSGILAGEKVSAGSLRGKCDASGTMRRSSARLASLLHGKGRESISEPLKKKVKRPVAAQKGEVTDTDKVVIIVEDEEEEEKEDATASQVSAKCQQEVIQVAKTKKPRRFYTHVQKINRSKSSSYENTMSRGLAQKERSAISQKKVYSGSSKGKSDANGTKRKRTSENLPSVTNTQTREGFYRPLQWKLLTSQRQSVTDNQRSRILEIAMSFKSKNPFTLVVMQDSYVYCGFLMHFPRPFVKEHLPIYKTEMTLRDPDGRPWKVTYLRSGCLSAGWVNFCRANILQSGDVCIFELIKENQMKVHISRVVRKRTPLNKNVRTRDA